MAVPKRNGVSDVGRFLRTPGPSGRATRVVIVLFALYVAELIAQGIGLPVLELARAPLRGLGAHDLADSWRNLTCMVIEDPSSGGVWTVLITLLIVWMLWPTLDDLLGSRRLAEALAFMAVGGLLVVNLVDALAVVTGVHVGRGLVLGWTPLRTGAFCLLGLLNPSGIMRLNFVLPVPMWVFTWGTLLLAVLGGVAAFGSGENILYPAFNLGIWIGAYGWYSWRGPGGRRRYLKSEAKKIERQLTRLRVLPGGRDETFH